MAVWLLGLFAANSTGLMTFLAARVRMDAELELISVETLLLRLRESSSLAALFDGRMYSAA